MHVAGVKMMDLQQLLHKHQQLRTEKLHLYCRVWVLYKTRGVRADTGSWGDVE
jgi:hypothetical protein